MPRILVIAPNWIGDAVMAQPLLARLHEKIAGLQLDVVAPEWVAPVVRRMPEVDAVIVAPFRHGALQLRERWRLGRELKARRYDQAVVLPNTWKSALLPFFADIPLRSGYVGESRYGLLNLTYRNSKGKKPMPAHYAALSEPPGKAFQEPLPAPRLRTAAHEVRAAQQKFGIVGPYAVFCPGAEYGPAKRWPYFSSLKAQTKIPVVLLGSRKDEEAAKDISSTHNLVGKTSLDEAIDLIAGAKYVVSNDSGLMHVAAALGKPQVALFGSSSPLHTPPLSEAARVLWLRVECSPCFQRECPLGHFRCMVEMTVDKVAAEIENLPS